MQSKLPMNQASLLRLKQVTGGTTNKNVAKTTATTAGRDTQTRGDDTSHRSSFSSYWMPDFSDEEGDEENDNKCLSAKEDKTEGTKKGWGNMRESFRSYQKSFREGQRSGVDLESVRENFDEDQENHIMKSRSNDAMDEEDLTLITKSSRPTTIHIPKEALRDNDAKTMYTKKTVSSSKSSGTNVSSKSKSSKGSSKSKSSAKQLSAASTMGSKTSSVQQIALFGADTKTGHYFLRLALDAGYRVRIMDPTDISQPSLRKYREIPHVLRNATFVVCFRCDILPKLYPLMRQETSIQVILYQATSLSADVTGGMPILAKVLKTVSQVGRRKDPHSEAVRLIGVEHGLISQEKDKDDAPHFSFIITRPTMLLKEGPSCRKLAASRSQPGPIPVSYVDLAEFSLNALRNEKLYNSCPYVVADSF